MELNDVREKVLKCQKCELYKTKNQYVFGEGDENSRILFIGEAPGANEDREGRPFVGKAGNTFNEMIESIGLNRDNIYICNILKCRPPGNRNPQVDEIKSCTPYLTAQIDLIKPKIICPMGNYATQFILKKFNLVKDKVEGISKIHGKSFKYKDLYSEIEIIPLYHPAVATYAPEMKLVLIKDMKLLENKSDGETK